MKKKLCAAILSLCMIICLTACGAASAAAEEETTREYEIGDFGY